MKITTSELQLAILYPVLLLLLSSEKTAGINIPVIQTTSNKPEHTNIVFSNTDLHNVLIPELISEKSNTVTLSDTINTDTGKQPVVVLNKNKSTVNGIYEQSPLNRRRRNGLIDLFYDILGVSFSFNRNPLMNSRTSTDGLTNPVAAIEQHTPSLTTTPESVISDLQRRNTATKALETSKSFERPTEKVIFKVSGSNHKSHVQHSNIYGNQTKSITELNAIALDVNGNTKSPTQSKVANVDFQMNDQSTVGSYKPESYAANAVLVDVQQSKHDKNDREMFTTTSSKVAFTSQAATNKVDIRRSIGSNSKETTNKVHETQPSDTFVQGATDIQLAVIANTRDKSAIIQALVSEVNSTSDVNGSKTDNKPTPIQPQALTGDPNSKTKAVAGFKTKRKVKMLKSRRSRPLAAICKKLKQKGLPTPPSCSDHNFDTWT